MSQAQIGFQDRVVIVTGAAAGIGRETAVRFARAGAKVVVADIQEDSGLETVQMIHELFGEAIFVPCDVAEAEQVEALVEKAISEYGALHHACNNAAIQGQLYSTTNCTLNAWDRVINVNLRGVWLCMKYQIPKMIAAGGGSIVNVASTAGLAGFPANPAYVASKHGVVGLTKTAAIEYASQKVRVNAVCPGTIETQLLDHLMRAAPGLREKVLDIIPEHRFGQPANVADAILYLCSDQSTYVTGQTLAVDGGWLAQ